MKKLIAVLLIINLIACKSEKAEPSHTNSESTLVADFLGNVKSLAKVKNGNPIAQFQDLAKDEAVKSYDLSKDNVNDLLETAKGFKHCVITTGDHTIVKVIDFEDCKPSGSWDSCMPMAKGFVKRGELDFEEDYINNIIGLPDDQERKVYLFD